MEVMVLKTLLGGKDIPVRYVVVKGTQFCPSDNVGTFDNPTLHTIEDKTSRLYLQILAFRHLIMPTRHDVYTVGKVIRGHCAPAADRVTAWVYAAQNPRN